MQRSSELPLFLQTAIAIFGFLFLVSMISPFSAFQSSLQSTTPATVRVTQN